MLNYDWSFGRFSIYTSAFADGALVTILLFLSTATFALVLGLIWGISLARSKLVRTLTFPLIDVLRSLPPLVLVLFGYFFLSPSVVGFSVPSFLAFTVCVGLNLSAFVADLVRSALTNVPKEYLQLSAAMAFTERQTLKYVVLPIAIRELIAPFAYLAIETVKLTSLASVINVHEMVYVAQGVIVNTGRSLEVWVIVSLIYVALIWPTSVLVRTLELRIKRTAGLLR
jgi:His/Glu/Gln/Arg/opine family amino acid ABC transporter permease subunit